MVWTLVLAKMVSRYLSHVARSNRTRNRVMLSRLSSSIAMTSRMVETYLDRTKTGRGSESTARLRGLWERLDGLERSADTSASGIDTRFSSTGLRLDGDMMHRIQRIDSHLLRLTETLRVRAEVLLLDVEENDGARWNELERSVLETVNAIREGLTLRRRTVGGVGRAG